MASWFRSWHGAPADPKWRVVARLAQADLSQVISTAWALLDYASQCPDRGSIHGADPDVIGESVGVEPAVVTRIIEAMHGKNILRDNGFAAWDERQPKREDDSSDRVTRHRERQRNAVKRTVTQCNAPDTDTDTDTETESEKSKTDASLRSLSCPPASPSGVKQAGAARVDQELRDAFYQFWPLYPRKVGKTRALEVWLREIRSEIVPDVIQAVLRYVELREGEPEQFTLHASTWLRNGRWRDALTDEKPKPPTGNGNGKPTISERNRQSRDEFLAAFGLSTPSPDSGTGQRSRQLRGLDDPAGG